MRGAARAGSDAACVRSRGTRAVRTPRSNDAPSLVRVVSERPPLRKLCCGFKLVPVGSKPLEPALIKNPLGLSVSGIHDSRIGGLNRTISQKSAVLLFSNARAIVDPSSRPPTDDRRRLTANIAPRVVLCLHIDPRVGMGMGATASGPTGAKDEYVVTYCRVRVCPPPRPAPAPPRAPTSAPPTCVTRS